MTDYVRKLDLEEFAAELADRVPDKSDLTDRAVVNALWKVMESDLRGYAVQNGMGRIKAVSAESGRSLDSVNPNPQYIQREGVALEKAALARLPVERGDRTKWDYSLFNHNRRVWELFNLWVRYLRDPRSLR